MNTDNVLVYAATHSDGLFDTADTAYCVQWKNFQGFKFAPGNDTTHLDLHFTNMSRSASVSADTDPDVIRLLVTANKQKEVAEDIAHAIIRASMNEGFVTLADPNADGVTGATISTGAGPRAKCSVHIQRIVSITYDAPDA